MKLHRWWLALVATFLTPWVGPHIDRYVPVGWVLARALDEKPDFGFWILAGVLLAVGYLAWVLVFTGLGWLRSRSRSRSR